MGDKVRIISRIYTPSSAFGPMVSFLSNQYENAKRLLKSTLICYWRLAAHSDLLKPICIVSLRALAHAKSGDVPNGIKFCQEALMTSPG